MAVAFDAATSPATSELVDFSWTHSPVGTPRGVIVWIIQGDDDATDRVSGVTYGGSAMTEVTGSPLLSPGITDRGAVYCYFLGSSIPTGNQTVAVDTDGTSREKHAVCVSLTASADTEIEDVDATISTTSAANPSVTLSLGGKTCWCGLGLRSGHGDVTGITPLTDWTSRLEHDYGSQVSGVYTYDIVGTSDVTAGWTQTAEDAQQIAVAITEVAGGSTYTLAADAGSYAITGTAASLEFGREVVAAAGSYAITGQNATLTKTIPLVAGAGAYAITGTAASLEFGRELVAGAGSYQITGQSVTLNYGKTLVAEASAYTITGQDASLEFNRMLAAGAGAYEISGFDASLTYTPSTAAPASQESGAGSGRKKWKVIALPDWLALHHPEESVEQQTEVIEELAATIAEAPPSVAQEVSRQLTLESRRVDSLISDLKRQSSRVEGLAAFLGEMADYRTALERAKRNALKAQKALREYDDEEAILTIIYHA